MIKIIVLTALFIMSGCATVSNSSRQMVRVEPDKLAGITKCSLKNEEGAWVVWAYQTIPIYRDGNPMQVDCENTNQIGSSTVLPIFQTRFLVIDFILIDACIISCIIDGATNSFYEYPNQITVPMRSK